MPFPAHLWVEMKNLHLAFSLWEAQLPHGWYWGPFVVPGLEVTLSPGAQ